MERLHGTLFMKTFVPHATKQPNFEEGKFGHFCRAPFGGFRVVEWRGVSASSKQSTFDTRALLSFLGATPSRPSCSPPPFLTGLRLHLSFTIKPESAQLATLVARKVIGKFSGSTMLYVIDCHVRVESSHFISKQEGYRMLLAKIEAKSRLPLIHQDKTKTLDSNRLVT